MQNTVSEVIINSNAGVDNSSVPVGSSNETSEMIYSTVASMVNTAAKRNMANKNNSAINKKITEVAETGTLSYRIDVIYKTGNTGTLKLLQPMDNIPRIPIDPEGNQSISAGNKTVSSTLQIVQSDIVSKITANIQNASLRNFSKVGSR